MPYSSVLYLFDLESLSARRWKLSIFWTKFVMMTVAYMTSYYQNVTYPYLINYETLQHILPHSIERYQSSVNYGWLHYQYV